MFGCKKWWIILGILSSNIYADEVKNNAFSQEQKNLDYSYQWQLNNDDLIKPVSDIFGLYSGLQFSDSWSINAGYQSHKSSQAIAVDMDTSLIESTFRYDWYVSNSVNIYGSVGVGFWESDNVFVDQNRQQSSGFSPLGGVGIGYTASPFFHLSTGYQYIHNLGAGQFSEDGSHNVVLSVSYSFGRDRFSRIQYTPTDILLESNKVAEPSS
ncbi:outer membrane beta-barrel protein [Vibrio galatheae]|uniref:outer membrane beta-barrel protein n=1 Tax=Vibrio galatheae TaxID=579748 RepID=UPI000696FDE3|nr:outer membrane beta-barrel protein [Vibrio galatheae]